MGREKQSVEEGEERGRGRERAREIERERDGEVGRGRKTVGGRFNRKRGKTEEIFRQEKEKSS